MTQTLQTPPSPLPIYFKAAMTAGRKPAPGVSLPPLQVALMNVRTDPARLDAYRQVCGLAEAPGLPLTYPQIAATGLHMHLMTQPQFPFPLLGLVHVRNRIRQTRPLGVDEAYDLHVSLGTVREARAGLEFDLLTEARVGEQAVWEASTTVLYRHRKPAAAGHHAQRIPQLRRPGRHRPALRPGQRRLQPHPSLSGDGAAVRFSARHRARHVESGALPGRAGSRAGAHAPRAGGAVQAAVAAARAGGAQVPRTG
jgi:hypothetical protein